MNKFLALYLILLSVNVFPQSEITSDEIYKHISFLASDSLKGRFSGTLEDKLAADYIISDLQNSGLTIYQETGLQNFDVITDCFLGEGNFFYNDFFTAEILKDYIPLSFSANSNLKSDVAFVGYGFDIEKDTMIWNDYSCVDVNGKWVLILRDLPKNSLSRDFFSLSANERFKAELAQSKGAVGVLFVSGYNSFNNELFIELKLSHIPGNIGIPVIQISRNLAEQLFKISEFSLKQVENIIIDSEASCSFDLNVKVDANVDIQYQKVKTQNVIAFIEGCDENLKNEYIVIGAHYDHLGFAGKNTGSKMKDTVAVHNGADDNASGIASVLEIAENIVSLKSELKRSVLIIAFGAEEKGMLGSEFFIENPIVELEKISAMINIDMIGRYRDSIGFNVLGSGTSTSFDSILLSTLENIVLKYNKHSLCYGGSDHVSFYESEIPVLVFSTGQHSDYHTPFDDLEFINTDAQTEITKLILSTAIKLINYEGEINYINFEK